MDPLVVRVLSRRSPTIAWRCSTCSRRSEFENTEKFRANANGKLIDVWLIYRCLRCGERKNLTVAERTPVSRLPARLLRAAQDNDPVLARSVGRDVALMRRNRVEVARGDDWRLPDPRTVPTRYGQVVVMQFEEPLLVRLDQIVAAALGLGRGQMRALGAIEVTPSGRVDRLRLWTQALVRTPDGGAP